MLEERHTEAHTGPIVFSDFDGTISQVDVTDAILENLADPAWREIEDEWVRGEIGSRECLKRQMALVGASHEELDRLIDAVAVDPGFRPFHRFLQDHAVPLYVVSDGFDYVIRRLLRRIGIGGSLGNGKDLFSSALKLARGGVRTSFPHPAARCEHGCATCKPAIMRRLRGGRRPVIFIGDGLSDRFAVHEADVVFAKDKLLDYCRESKVDCQLWRTFADVERTLARMIAPARPKRPQRGSRRATVSVA